MAPETRAAQTSWARGGHAHPERRRQSSLGIAPEVKGRSGRFGHLSDQGGKTLKLRGAGGALLGCPSLAGGWKSPFSGWLVAVGVAGDSGKITLAISRTKVHEAGALRPLMAPDSLGNPRADGAGSFDCRR